MKTIFLLVLVVLGVSIFAVLQYNADAARALSKLELHCEAHFVESIVGAQVHLLTCLNAKEE